jgi:hypothetical protein
MINPGQLLDTFLSHNLGKAPRYAREATLNRRGQMSMAINGNSEGEMLGMHPAC